MDTASDGIIDLDAMWNPTRDEEVPLIQCATRNNDNSDNDSSDDRNGELGPECGRDNHDEAKEDTKQLVESFRVRKAHVILSPFGRPTGWNLKLANASVEIGRAHV